MRAAGDDRWHAGTARMMMADAVQSAAMKRSRQDEIAREMIARSLALRDEAAKLLAAAEADEKEDGVWVR